VRLKESLTSKQIKKLNREDEIDLQITVLHLGMGNKMF